MQVVQRTWSATDGWSGPLEARGQGTIVLLAFGGRIPGDVLASAAAAFPTAVCIGCSTSGEIAGESVHDDAVSLAIVTLEHTEARVATVPANDAAGTALAAALDGPDLRHVFVVSDGLSVNGSALAGGLREALAPGVVVTGGLAGDGPRFDRTWVWAGGELLDGQVVALGLHGDAFEVEHATGRGWDPFGVVRTVTRAEDNVLFELDGRPALDLYKEYLGELADQLPATGLLFPLAILDRHGEDVVRTILAVDEDARSMTFAGDIPQGARVRLMRTTLDRLVDGAADAAAAIEPAEPVLAVVVSCVGRRLVLDDRVEEEVEAIAECLPDGSGLLGFYSYGELSPTADGTTDLHNQTMTLTLWRERKPT
jgi:hypothetical protein